MKPLEGLRVTPYRKRDSLSTGGNPAALIHQRLAKGALLALRPVCPVDDEKTAAGAQQTVPSGCHQLVVRSHLDAATPLALGLPAFYLVRVHHQAWCPLPQQGNMSLELLLPASPQDGIRCEDAHRSPCPRHHPCDERGHGRLSKAHVIREKHPTHLLRSGVRGKHLVIIAERHLLELDGPMSKTPSSKLRGRGSPVPQAAVLKFADVTNRRHVRPRCSR